MGGGTISEFRGGRRFTHTVEVTNEEFEAAKYDAKQRHE
jgi:hypothetical protein